ncbi:glucose-6-phosphate isomerase, partial [Xanthomonas sp. Kuri4-1]
EAHATAAGVRAQMRDLIEALAATGVTDIVSVGIGGSDLGPRLVADALRPVEGARFRVHFVSNVDGAAMQRTLATLDPARTAGVLISKTFGTQETLLNGRILHDWLGGSERLYAVSANPERAAKAFDIGPGRVLPMWDWVGGRYSLWSAVGFPIALAIGFGRFEQLLAGAAEFDAHVLDTPLEDNVAVLHGLTAVWNRNLLGHATHAVMTYDQRMALLPAYLQQLVMESLGKRVKLDGSPVDSDTVAVWWGGAGTDVQHSFFQALHQGTSAVPADFIGTVHNDDPYVENHQALLANLLAQTEALANGQDSSDPHRSYPGGRPSTLILFDALTPAALGALISMYEHSVYVQSVMWGINAFDQFGVELGKQLASQLLPALQGEPAQIADPVTRAVLAQLRGA